MWLWRTLVFNLRVQFSKNFWWGIVPFHKPLSLGLCIVCIYYLFEKTSSFIHSLVKQSKFFPQKFTLSQAAHADANPTGTLFKTCHCLFMSSKKAFRSYSHDFEVCVSDMAMLFNCKDLWCALHRWSGGLISKKTGNRLTFFFEMQPQEKHQ